jgi:hypothetical protein
MKRLLEGKVSSDPLVMKLIEENKALEIKLDAAQTCLDHELQVSKSFARSLLEAEAERDAAQSRLHQLSEDHSHCEDLLHELGARASSAENRLHSVRLFIDTPHPHWGQGEVLDGVREILDGVVERQCSYDPSTHTATVEPIQGEPIMGFRKERSTFFAPTFSRCGKCGEEYQPGFDHACE